MCTYSHMLYDVYKLIIHVKIKKLVYIYILSSKCLFRFEMKNFWCHIGYVRICWKDVGRDFLKLIKKQIT